MQKHQIFKRINQTKHQRSRKLDLGKRAPLSQATWALHPCPSPVFFQEVRQGRAKQVRPTQQAAHVKPQPSPSPSSQSHPHSYNTAGTKPKVGDLEGHLWRLQTPSHASGQGNFKAMLSTANVHIFSQTSLCSTAARQRCSLTLLLHFT